MVARKTEEHQTVKKATSFLSEEERVTKRDRPLMWLIVDQAHEFLPNEGKTAATHALVTILREGRQPGISLVLASQLVPSAMQSGASPMPVCLWLVTSNNMLLRPSL